MRAHSIAVVTLCVILAASVASAKERGKQAKEGGKQAKEHVKQAQEGGKQDPAARAEAFFKKVDTDGSGTVSLAEFTVRHEQRMTRLKERMGDKWDPKRAEAMPTAEAIFARMDTDNSGGLTLEEMKAGHDRKGMHHKGEKGKHGPEARKGAKGKGACKAPAKAAPEAQPDVDAE